MPQQVTLRHKRLLLHQAGWHEFPHLACLQGAAVYAPEKEAMVWKIKNFPGGKEFLLRCKFGLPSVEAEEEAKGRMPPIRVKFEIPYFTVSGIQVGSSMLLNLMPPTCITRMYAPRVVWPE